MFTINLRTGNDFLPARGYAMGMASPLSQETTRAFDTLRAAHQRRSAAKRAAAAATVLAAGAWFCLQLGTLANGSY